MIERAMNGLPQERSMRDKFDTDMQFVNASRGINSYSFSPRQ